MVEHGMHLNLCLESFSQRFLLELVVALNFDGHWDKGVCFAEGLVNLGKGALSELFVKAVVGDC